MGAWDVGVWDNDDAADWGGDLSESKGQELVRAALNPEDADGSYLEAPEGSVMLCASDVVLEAVAPTTSTVPPEVRGWLENQDRQALQALRPLAVSALKRVLGEQSELRQLWEESEDEYQKWKGQVEGMLGALGG